jgi:predicted O-methyltransferase YrrM
VTDPLDSVLAELEQFGKANDASAVERTRRMLNITRDTGEFLAVLVRATLARRVLEIGTSNGYSTLWLANAARAIGGSVTTVELADYKIGLAAANFARAGLARYISIVHDDAGRVLESSADASYDLVFLDSERPNIPGGGQTSGAYCGLGIAGGRQRDVPSGADGAVRGAGQCRC